MDSLTELIAAKMQRFFVFCKHLTSGFLEANRFSGPMTSLNMFYQVCFDLPSWHFFPDKNELLTKKIAVRFDFSTHHLTTFPLFHWLLITAPGQNWKQKNNKILLQQPIMANTCRLHFWKKHFSPTLWYIHISIPQTQQYELIQHTSYFS